MKLLNGMLIVLLATAAVAAETRDAGDRDPSDTKPFGELRLKSLGGKTEKKGEKTEKKKDQRPARRAATERPALRLRSLADLTPGGYADMRQPAKPNVRADVVGYYGLLDYRDTAFKQQAHLAGVYSYFGFGPADLLETEVDYTDIRQKTIADLQQFDFAAVYTKSAAPWRVRLGAHYIVSDDKPTDDGWTAIFGVSYYEAGKWDAGVDGFFTRYENFRPALNVYQVTPRLGVNLRRTWTYTLRNDLSAHGIYLGNEVGLNRKRFASVEDKVSLFWKQWTFAASGWIGKQTFAVRNGGFTVFNLAEEHRRGFGAEVRYALSRKIAIALKASREQFKEIGRSRNSSSNTVVGTVGVAF